MDDEQLERAMRDGLRRKAYEVEVGGGYAETAHRGARRRGRVKVAGAALVAAAVIVPVAVIAQQSAGTDTVATDGSSSGAAPNASGWTAGPAPAVPANWRVESYNGIQLRVPPDWGWGGTPSHLPGSDGLGFCGPGAFAYPGEDGVTHFKEEVDMPYVGRAGYSMTDICLGHWVASPRHPWVWLGAQIDVGTEELSNGFAQQTVEVGGVHVTVGDDDPEEMATILGSLEAVDVDANGCEVETDLSGSPQGLGGINGVRSVSVCVYRHLDDESVMLGYSTTLAGEPAQHTFDVIEQTPAGVIDCGDPQDSLPLDDVILRFRGRGGDVDVLARLGGHLGTCGGYYTGPEARLFTRANVEPWVVDAVGLYVSGGMVGNALSGIFRPMPG